MKRIALIAVVTAALLAAAPASAKRAPLTQHRADRAAQREVQEYVEFFAEFHDPSAPDGPITTIDGDTTFYALNALVRRVDIDPCDLIGTSAAECDATLDMSDGSQCDVSIDEHTTRRGRLVVDSEILCDALGDG